MADASATCPVKFFFSSTKSQGGTEAERNLCLRGKSEGGKEKGSRFPPASGVAENEGSCSDFLSLSSCSSSLFLSIDLLGEFSYPA